MQKFLDDSGVRKIWTNIKQYIDEKLKSSAGGSGVDFTTDDTLTMDDGVLSVTNPVNGIMSQEDYDALPPEEKKKGSYLIPLQEEAFLPPSKNIYSEEEVLIGSWFGDPLFRKTKIFNVDILSGKSTTVTWNDVIASNSINLLIDIRGMWNLADGSYNYYSINRSNTNQTYINYAYVIDGNLVATMSRYDFNTSAKVVLIIEYTKTTDK